MCSLAMLRASSTSTHCREDNFSWGVAMLCTLSTSTHYREDNEFTSVLSPLCYDALYFSLRALLVSQPNGQGSAHASVPDLLLLIAKTVIATLWK